MALIPVPVLRCADPPPMHPAPHDPPTTRDVLNALALVQDTERKYISASEQTMGEGILNEDDRASVHTFFHRVLSATSVDPSAPLTHQAFADEMKTLREEDPTLVSTMAHIPVPTLHCADPPPMPPAPSVPPTNRDVLNALALVKDIEKKYISVSEQTTGGAIPNEEDRANAHTFCHQVLSAASAPAPSVPSTALADELRMLKEEVRNLANETRDQFLAMRNELDNFKSFVGGVSQLSARAYNKGAGDGTVTPYYPMLCLLQNGTIVTPEELGLPRLNNEPEIANLADDDLHQYLYVYGIGGDPNADRMMKLARLKTFIGYGAGPELGCKISISSSRSLCIGHEIDTKT